MCRMMREVVGGMVDRMILFFESHEDELSALQLEQASWGICTRIINKQLNQINYKERRRKVLIQRHSNGEQNVPEIVVAWADRRQFEKFGTGELILKIMSASRIWLAWTYP